MQRLRRAFEGAEDRSAGFDAPLVDAAEVERLCPDVIVSWSYPHILPASTLACARAGALNVHMALLPRHRGVDPLFWTYWDDDSNAGVTIHWMNERIDAGDVVVQDALPLLRGLPSRELYIQLASRSTDLLAAALMMIASGEAPRRPQDESHATYESAADTARARVPFAHWPSERVWHVLSGLGDLRSGLLGVAADSPLEHGRATCYRIVHHVQPGRIVPTAEGYELHCLDGIVAVDRRSRRQLR